MVMFLQASVCPGGGVGNMKEVTWYGTPPAHQTWGLTTSPPPRHQPWGPTPSPASDI